MRKRIVLLTGLVVICTVATCIAQSRRDIRQKPIRVASTEQTLAVEAADRHATAVQEAMRYKGIKVRSQDDVRGAERTMQSRAARALEDLDFVPDHRKEVFGQFAQVSRQTVSGWDARIREATPSPDGLLVVLEVHPTFADAGFATTTYTLEKYLVGDRQVRFIESIAPPVPKISVQN